MSTATASLIETISRSRIQLQSQPVKQQRLQTLQRWQTERLRRTYADFSRQKRYRDALEFFVEDLYGPHDYSQRDHDLNKVLAKFERLLSARALQTLATALQLEALTQELDWVMLEYLAGDINESSYAQAYRQVARASDRQHQIALIVAAGRALDALVDNPAIGAALWAARLPAKMYGVMTLHTFLERGYRAFTTMCGAQRLLTAIEKRETAIMTRLLAGTAEPFCWSGAEPAAATP